MRALLLIIIVIGVVGLTIYVVWKRQRERLRQQRRAAWHAKRDEEDRIWSELMEDD